jgi:phospholipase A1
MPTEVLVFVPGTTGSELFDGSERAWPGSLLDWTTGFSDAKFKRLMKPTLVHGDIIRSAAGGFVDIYSQWIEAFEAIRRGPQQLFREEPPPGTPKTLRPFPYDWRLDLEITTPSFASFLDDILSTIPDADIKLVCHSQGGMLGRYYLESGVFNARPAFPRISLFATFGTPHNGAPIAYAAAVGLHNTSFLSVKQTRVLANDSQYPSLYQLFPDPSHSFIWNSAKGSAIDSVPPDHPALITNFGLNRANLARWESFRKGLTGKRPPGVRYFYFIGSRQQTLTRLSWDGHATLEKEEIEDSGDGTVSLLSSVERATQSQFVGKAHVSLIDSLPARQTFAALFRAETLFAAQEEEITLAVRKVLVTTDEAIHIQIEFGSAQSQVNGVLRFQRAEIPDASSPPQSPVFSDVSFVRRIPIDVISNGIVFLNLKSLPITTRGVYRPVFSKDGKDTVGPQFIVQQG